MKNKIRTAVLFFILPLLFAACKGGADDLKEQGYVKAVVKDFTGLDGCTFMIVPDEGDRLEPTNLPEDYKTDGLKVWVKYKDPDQPMASICMAGEIVEIVDIKKR